MFVNVSIQSGHLRFKSNWLQWIRIIHCKNHQKARFLLIFVSLSFFNLFCNAQIPEWSNSRKLKGNAVFTRVLGENANGIFLMRYRNRFFTRSILIDKYRNHLGFNFSRNILLRKSRLVAIDMNENGILLFTSKVDRVNQKNELSAQYFDFNVLPKTRDQLLIKANMSDPYEKGDFRVQSSSDLSKYLIYYSEKTADQKRMIHLNVYDDQMKLQGTKSAILPINYEDYSLIETAVDNQGNAFLLVKEKSKISKKSDSDWQAFRLFYWQMKKDKFDDILLNDSGTYVHGLTLSIDRFYNRVNVTGFYSGRYSDRFSGVYVCKIEMDSTNNAKRFFTDLPLNLMSNLIGEKQAMENEEAYDFKQLKAIPLSNGSTAIVAERSSMSSEEDIIYVNGVPQNTSRNIYNFDDVIILCIDTSGALAWHRIINKSQSSLNDGGYYSSVIVGVTKDNIHLIFNDKMRGNGNVLQYTLNANGEMSNKILLRSDREYIAVIPSESLQISSNKLLIPTTKDKKFALLKLVY